MFKRANKVTALLVAAASVMSIVPAMAADSSRLGTKDGTIENAIAFKDGKYLYEGYRSDSDDAGIYYNGGDADKLLEDVEDADLNYEYADKYAYANDGSDQYLVDLSNGDVLDDDTPEDREDTAATKLKTALKKTDRYGSTITVNATDLSAVPGGKFADNWYLYAVTPVASADGANNTVGGKLYGFTNESGKYIDASNLANVYAYSSAKGKVVKIEEFSNDASDVDDDTQLLATLVDLDVLTQDADYIYAKATVQIYDAHAVAGDITGTTTGAAVATGAVAGDTVTRTYIQKIAKAQGDVKDEAYLPKTVASYEVTKNELDSSDADDAYDAIAAATGYTVVGDQLLVINNSGTNVKVTTVNLKKDKVEYEVTEPTTFDATKVDVYLAEKDDADDVDIDDTAAVDIDVDGNVWAVADGKIYKFANNEFTKVYTTDSSIDQLNVYDENNLIAWEEDGDIYTTVSEGTAETASEATVVAPAAPVTGWVKGTDGTWTFNDYTGAKVTSKWVNYQGSWYFLKADGIMATGWYNDNGTWYYLAGSGAMATGWFLDTDGNWYYLAASGAMLANTTVDGYKLGASGAWVR